MLYRFWIRACIAILGALFGLFVVASDTTAATCTWNDGSGDWHDASKWSCGAVPTASDDVVIGSDLAYFYGTITINQTAPANTVRIINSIGSNGTITGTAGLNLTGELSITSSYL